MSRRNQDIPIRPRYGIVDTMSDDIQQKADVNNMSNKGTTTASLDKVTSSYTEIPFLAKYPYGDDHPDEEPCRTADNIEGVVGGEFDSSIDDESPDNDEEISSNSENINRKRPDSLQCDSSIPFVLNTDNSTETGEMRHFVADTLEEELRGATPQSRKPVLDLDSRNSTPSTSMPDDALTRRFLQTQLPQIDANVLNDIEIEAQYLAASIDNLTENLGNLLHSISAITLENVEVHKNAVNKLTDIMDANIKCMYTIMAKAEEITKSMKPTEQLGQRVREIRRLVDILDSTL